MKKTEEQQARPMLHSVLVDQRRCMGCTTCIKSCPVSAIRVREGKAVILGRRCIDCGACIQVCPHHAIRSKSDDFSRMEGFAYRIALPDPALYGQFHNLTDVNLILSGLKAIGFDRVWEVAAAAELLSYSAREKGERVGAKPLLSSGCPAVMRLIRIRFPELIGHIDRVLMPAEIAAQLARREAVRETGLKPEEIGIFLIAPCASKVTAVHNPEGLQKATIDGAFSVQEIYRRLLGAMRRVKEPEPLSKAGKLGVAWAASGGECASRGAKRHIAADGIQNVIRLLSELEDGRVPEAEFVELSACTGGCLGGCLNVENPFVAKMRLEMVMEQLPPHGEGCAVEDEALLQFDRELSYAPVFVLDSNRDEAMRKAREIDALRARLPGLDCGSCGAPNCYAHAEDVVMGRSGEDACIFRVREKVRALQNGEEYLPYPFRRRREGD